MGDVVLREHGEVFVGDDGLAFGFALAAEGDGDCGKAEMDLG